MQEDRRKYYRIEHEAVLDYKPVNHPDDELLPDPFPFDITPQLLQILRLEQLGQQLTRSLSDEQADTSRQLSEQLHAGLQELRRDLLPEQLQPDIKLTPRLINLSEGGMALYTHEPLQLNSRLILTLLLPQDHLGLLIYGQVQYSREEEGEYFTGIEFETMPERCRTRLAASILSYQAQIQREKNDQDPAT